MTGGQEVGSSNLPTPTELKEPNLNWVPFLFAAMYFTYILFSTAIGKFYVGSTQNLDERLRRHNSDHSISTKGKGPWVLVRSFEHHSRSDAIKLENKIKRRGIKRFLDDLQQSG